MISAVVNKYHIAFWRLCFLTLLVISLDIGRANATDMLSCLMPAETKTTSKGKTVTGFAVDCPEVKGRNDIDPRCIQAQSALNSCVDIMPVENKSAVQTIPEDICFRDWSDGARNHNGLDYSIGQGQAVIAAADGEILEADFSCSNTSGVPANGNGNYVKIKHPVTAPQESDNGAIVSSGHTSCFMTYYLHLSAFGINPKTGKKWVRGDKVSKGQKIGEVGGTGNGCKIEKINGVEVKVPIRKYGVHLHYEIRTCGGATLNPFCPYLTSLCPEGAANAKSSTTSSSSSSSTNTNFGANASYNDGQWTNQNSSAQTTETATDSSTVFDPNQCRDCQKNAEQCKLMDYVGTGEGLWAGGTGGGSSGAAGDDLSVLDMQPQSTGKCTYQNYQDSVKGCIFCDIFKVLFNTASTVAAKAFKALTPAVSLVVVIATAIWIAFTILKYLSSMEVKEPRAMVKEILNKLFLVFFILVILQFGPLTFIEWTIYPIFNTGMKLALLTASSELSCGGEAGKGFDVLTLAEGGALPEGMGQDILCVVKTIQDSIMRILSLGSTSLCIGFFEKSFWRIPIFPHFGYVLTGLGLWVSAILVLLIYPWLLVDCVLKLSVAVALVPTAIGAFAFNMTRRYVTKIWEIFLNSMFTFVFLSIIIYILITMIDQSLKDANIDDVISRSEKSFESLLDAIGWWGVTFLKICFTLLLGWAVLDEGTSFADDFAGGMKFNQSIGSKVGTTMMSGAKGVAAPVAKGAAKAGKVAGKAVGSTVKEKMNNAKLERKSKGMENDVKKGRAVKNEDGSITKTHTDWRGRTVTQTMASDASGNKLMTKSKTDSKGNTTTTTTDKFMSSKVQTNKNGKVISEEFQMKAAGGKYLINKDGSLNQVAMKSIMNNSLHGKETVQKALANQLLKERFGDDKGLSKTFKDRNVNIGKDEKGNMTFQMTQTNHDGSTRKINMTMGDKRAMIEMENIDKKGNSSYVASDGIINKTRNMKYDKSGNVIPKSVKQNYSFTSHYTRSTRSIDSLGKFAKWIPEDEIMHSQENIKDLTKQVGKYGRPQQTQGLEILK